MTGLILSIVAVLAGILILLILVVGLFGAGAYLFRGRAPDPAAARAEGLKGLGYEPGPDGSWLRPIQGTTMRFAETPAGLVWKMQLPRYNTMTLQLVEASGGRAVERPIETGIHAIDSRFHVGSPHGDRVVNLLSQPKLQKALLRAPHLALTLSADELILEDPGKAGVAALGGDPLEAELNEHALIVNVINAFFGVLYSETGTTLEAFR